MLAISLGIRKPTSRDISLSVSQLVGETSLGLWELLIFSSFSQLRSCLTKKQFANIVTCPF